MSLDWSALQILDAMPDIVYLKDPSGRNVFVNKAYCDLLSLPKESLIGKTDAELLPPSLAEKCRASDDLAISTGAPVRVEEQDVANGHKRFFETIKNPIMRDGALIGILGISRDITHHKVIEARLAESEEMYRRLIETCPDAIIQIDPSGKILLANRRMAEITGYKDQSELIGRNSFELIPSSEMPRISAMADKIFDSERVSFEVAMLRKDGSTFDANVAASAIRKGGALHSVIGIARDITSQKKAEQDLMRYSKDLERLVEEKTAQLRDKERLAAIGETAAMVGHDLRTPLQVLANAFYVNEMEARQAPKEFQAIAEAMGLPKVNETIMRQISYMEKIVLNLQDFARDIVPKPAAFDLAQIIADSFPPALSHNIKVITDFGAKTVFADGYMIRRAISNLISNAIQAMPQGGTLTISTRKRGGTIDISVSDNGCGMDERALANLFKPLCTTKAKGMGMGMVVVKKMVELHGGVVHVESAVGRGTTFTIMLPDKTP
ncbi:MAG TPA: PAS domain S-box protein [Candidatus Methanomethylicus sp.]|nr:PAS domain S-box protein [Candidatus Methanomethylicus sp.]